VITPATEKKRYAVIGAGPAGLACATTLAERGHHVSLYDRAREIGGQFNYAKRIPGKEEFHETLRYFTHRLADTGVEVILETSADAELLRAGKFDAVILASGITPRHLAIPGIENEKVLSYLDVLRDDKPVGPRVAIIGAGGIGFDTAEFLVQSAPSPSTDTARWLQEWGVDASYAQRGGLTKPHAETPERQIWLLQRTEGTPGKRLNKTSGWVHRATLKMKGVKMLGGVNYQRIDDAGLHVTIDGKEQVIEVDNVIICAGQEPNRELQAQLQAAGMTVHLVGGADVAAELDAKRAIDQATRLAAQL